MGGFWLVLALGAAAKAKVNGLILNAKNCLFTIDGY
jgi:hypothetical protein